MNLNIWRVVYIPLCERRTTGRHRLGYVLTEGDSIAGVKEALESGVGEVDLISAKFMGPGLTEKKLSEALASAENRV